jgi:spermidine/putrescine-binding protein
MGTAVGLSATLPASVQAQTVTTVDVMAVNAVVEGKLREILERDAKIRIEAAPFQSSTDVVSRLLAPGGSSRYDFMQSHTVFSRGPILGEKAGAEKVAALDLKLIPNVSLVADVFRGDIIERDGKTYGLPTIWGYDSVLYNRDKIPENDPATQTWGLIFDDSRAGRIGWFDAPLHMLMAAGLFLGKTAPETMVGPELEEVGKFLIAKKKNVRTIWTSFAQGSNLLANGEIDCTYGPIPVRYELQQRGFNITNAWCKEGVLSFVQAAYIPKDAKRKEAAHAMINSMLGSAYASQLSPLTGYLSTSKAGAQELTEAERKRWGYGILDGSTKHYPLKLPSELAKWIEIWSRVKSA